MATRERPQLREESVESLLMQAVRLCCVCWVPLLVLSLVSTLYGTAKDSYTLIPGLGFPSSSDMNNVSLPQHQKIYSTELSYSNISSSSQGGRVSKLHDGGLYEGSEDKGLLARYIASFLISLDEAVMESLVDSRNRMAMYESGGVESSSVGPPLPSQSSETISTGFEVSSTMETKDGVALAQTQEARSDAIEAMEPIPQLSLRLRILGKNESYDTETLQDEGVKIGMPSATLIGGRAVDRGALPHMGLTVLFMLGVLAGAIMTFFAVLVFQHAALLGTVAYTVVSTYVGKRVSAVQAMKAGFRTGLLRLIWLAVLHDLIRDLLGLLTIKTSFGGVMKGEAVDRLVLRLSTMPFPILAPFKDADSSGWGMASRIAVFVILDYVFDMLASCVYIMACWVTIMEREHWGFAALARACNLVTSVQNQVLSLKLLESVLCGRSARWVLQQFLGPFLSLLLVSAGQLYFYVCWLVLYFSARCKQESNPQFTHRVLEDFLDRVR
ncbi:unnamed protein product [Sphagnum compactum]